MSARWRTERRAKNARAHRLEDFTLLQIPKRIAVASIVLAVGLIALVDYLSPQVLWFGPAYLAVITFTAWSYSCRSAIVLGLAIIAINVLMGDASTSPFGTNTAVLNLALKFFAVLGIVLFLGAARRALQKEWKLARTDQLTGSLNRQAFFDAIAAETSWCGWSVLIYADLDGLKQLNDNLGHEHGDKALISFANRVRSAIRKDDLFARIGGDEFVVFMNVRDKAAGILVAHRLNQVLNVQSSEDDAELRGSLGALLLPPGSRSIDADLKAADTLMYEAKRTQIGMLAATAQRADDGVIVLSRHIAQDPPAERRFAVRSNERRHLAAPDRTGFSGLDEPYADEAAQRCLSRQDRSIVTPLSVALSASRDEKGRRSKTQQKAGHL